MLKQTYVLPSSENLDFNTGENIALRATYFSKNESLNDYLAAHDRTPKPNFSDYQ